MHWLFRLALKLVPESWRDAVRAEIDHDAVPNGGGCVWRLIQLLGIGIRLRWTISGGGLLCDVRCALRALSTSGWFAIGAVVTFALGIGVSVAVFSAVDRILFRPLPYGEPNYLFAMTEYVGGKPSGTVAGRDAFEARRQHQGFVDLAVVDDARGYATAPDEPTSITLTPVSSNALRLFQVKPYLGRDFTDDDVREKRAVTLLTFESWTSKFGRASDVMGRRLWNGTQTPEIIGVLPKGFIPPPAIFDVRSDGVALDSAALDEPSQSARVARPVVRLRPGVVVAAAEAELDTLARRLREDAPASAANRTPTPTYRLMPLRGRMFDKYTQYVWLIVGGAALVLLMCCANLANLWLVRGRSREQIAALQIALGASRGRLVRSALVESIILAAIGTMAAVVVLGISNSALVLTLPAPFNRYIETATDLRVLVFSSIVALLCGVAAALWPALRASQVDVLPALQQSAGRRVSGRLRGGSSLLIVETAIGVLLVAGGALTARSLVGLWRTDLGFQPAGLHEVSVGFPFRRDDEPAARMQPYLQALGMLRRLNGVQAAAGAIVLPTSGATDMTFGRDQRGLVYRVTDGFFETMGARLVSGRVISADDVTTQADVAVLTDSGVAYLWPGSLAQDAVGRMTDGADRPRRVVGVVADIRGALGAPATPSLYVPINADKFRFMMFIARTAPAQPFPMAELRERAVQLGATKARLFAEDVESSLSAGILNPRFRAVLFGVFGQIALVLAAVGLYSVTAFEIALRRFELGVRISLGASPAQLRRKVLTDALRPVIVGVAAGVVAAWWAGRFLQGFLRDVDARDPVTHAFVAATLIATGVVAAWFPAQRAARIDPAEVLRAQ